MCAAIHAVTNGLIEYLVYTTLMYTQPFAVYMALITEAQTRAQRINLTYWLANCTCTCKSCYEMRKSIQNMEEE